MQIEFYEITIQACILARVVNVVVLVLVPIVSAILFVYSIEMSSLSAILFHLFFGNIRYQYFSRQVIS